MPSRPTASLALGVLLALSAGTGLIARPAFADDTAPAGLKGEMLMSLGDAEHKLSELADAIPASKYTWSPGKGVRSVADVFMHVAAENYGVPAMLGVAAPEGFKLDQYEKSLSKKEDIQKAMKESFASMKAAITNLPEADMDKEAEIFGMKMSQRAIYMMMVTHCHEHLGQMIAYARMNGIVPPWTAREQMAEKAKAAGGK